MIAPDFDIEEVDMVFLEKSLKFLDEHKKQKPEKPFFFFFTPFRQFIYLLSRERILRARLMPVRTATSSFNLIMW